MFFTEDWIDVTMTLSVAGLVWKITRFQGLKRECPLKEEEGFVMQQIGTRWIEKKIVPYQKFLRYIGLPIVWEDKFWVIFDLLTENSHFF